MSTLPLPFLIGLVLIVLGILGYLIFSGSSSSTPEPVAIRYDIYIMSTGERILWIVLAGLVIFGVGFFIYRSMILASLLTPFALFYPKQKARSLLIKRKNVLRRQFKDMLYSLSSALAAGKSVELAFRAIQEDLKMLYPGRTGYIVHELARINTRLGMNEPVEVVMLDFASRTGMEEIMTFSDIMAASKRTGGNLVDIIKNTSRIITEKLEFMMELDTMLAQRKLEQKVMGAFPFVIVLMMSGMAPEYMEPVFYSPLGNLIMTGVLVVFVIAWKLGAKIVDIEV